MGNCCLSTSPPSIKKSTKNKKFKNSNKKQYDGFNTTTSWIDLKKNYSEIGSSNGQHKFTQLNTSLQPRRDLDLNTNSNFIQIDHSNSEVNEASNTQKQKLDQHTKSQNPITTAEKLIHKLSLSKHHHHNSHQNQINEHKIQNLFDKYKSKTDENFILANGIQQLCDDLCMKPNEFKILIFAWKLNAKTMCKFTRDEFLNGFKINLKCDNLKDVRQRLSEIEIYLKTDTALNEFKQFYRWSFEFGLDNDIGERTLPLQIAISLWELVYTINEPIILKDWLNFLNTNQNHIKGISRDIWYIFPLFANTIGDFNFESYDDNEAWPCLFDDYVQFELQKRNFNKNESNDELN